MDLKIFKEKFDQILKNYITQKTQEAKTLLGENKLSEYIDYIDPYVFSGGKRIRPYGVWIMYKGFGGEQDQDVLQFSIIFELLHTMALIHDDIIDESEKRHNVLTMHSYIGSLLGAGNQRVAEGQAMLLGDLMLSWVYELGNKHHNFSEKILKQARENVHSMIEEVILGQMIDVDMMAGGEANQDKIEKKNYLKTASYTFIRPMLTGAILAGADETQKAGVVELGKYLGLAFQLRDDLMDITFGDTTKSPFSDIQEGQQTYFTHYIYSKGSPEAKETLKSAMGKTLSEKQIKDLQKLFQDSGAIEAGKNLLQEYIQKAQNALDTISFSEPVAKQGLEMLIEKIAKT